MDADQPAELKVCKQIEDVERSEHGLVMSVGRLADLQPATVNINKSDVHFGDKFITQNVTTTDDFRGRAGAWRCRGSVLVCVCWAGVLAAALSAVLLLLLLSNNHRLDIGLNTEWYLRRDDWQAMPPYAVNFMTLPLHYVIVGHSVTSMCRDRYTCIRTVMAIQQDHLRREFDDIGPNFLVGSGGYILEGRGANVLGAMTKGWNTKSISVMFLGDYTKDETDIKQFENVQVLLDKLEESGVLVSDYKILGYCQVRALTFSPGKNVMEEMHRLRHWEPAHSSDCIGFSGNHT